MFSAYEIAHPQNSTVQKNAQAARVTAGFIVSAFGIVTVVATMYISGGNLAHSRNYFFFYVYLLVIGVLGLGPATLFSLSYLLREAKTRQITGIGSKEDLL